MQNLHIRPPSRASLDRSEQTKMCDADMRSDTAQLKLYIHELQWVLGMGGGGTRSK